MDFYQIFVTNYYMVLRRMAEVSMDFLNYLPVSIRSNYSNRKLIGLNRRLANSGFELPIA